MTILPNTSVVIDPIMVLDDLTYEEKVCLLAGGDMWHTFPVPRLNVPRVRMSDGPNGIRGTSWLNSAPSACFPCATGTASTFDVDLLFRIGEALGNEARARGTHCILGPTTNVQRDPRGGRGFESFSEDPHLAGVMARSWIEGVQSVKVMTSPKHLVCNEQELNRRSTNSVLDERTLHEIYLEPFRLQCQANPQTFMASYNRLNGLHASEDPHLLRDILRGDFKFNGMVMSDWGGTYSAADSIAAGLDLEMPGPSMMRLANVERKVVSGKLAPEAIDACVLNVLGFVKNAQLSGIPFEAQEGTIDSPAVRALLRESAAASTTLLKNDNGVLPLRLEQGQTVAVIGPNAKAYCISGGGSASLTPTYRVSPYEAIESHAREVGARVTYTVGTQATRWTPLLDGLVKSVNNTKGFMTVDFFTENPFAGATVKPAHSMDIRGTYGLFTDGIPSTVPIRGYVRVRGTLIPDQSGLWTLGLTVAGQGDLYVDGQLVVENSKDQVADVSFYNTGTEERLGDVELEAGRSYQLEVRFSNFKQISAMSPYAGRRGAIRVGGKLNRDPQEEIDLAVELAKKADVTILCIGLNNEWESESYDRSDIRLPGLMDDLVRSVLAVNSNSVIVNQSGMPVEMPWIDQASTVLQAYYGGNECGNGIADALFGKVNPSGKLPFTWPKQLEDYPGHEDFGHPVNTVYSEGLGVGYRHFDRKGGPKSLFSFGHGLSYTRFSYSHIKSTWSGPITLDVKFTVTNRGDVSGREAGLVFVHAVRPPVARPEIELAAFNKTAMLHPGESQDLCVSLDIKAFSYYSIDRHAWVAEKGAYEIRVGPSSTVSALQQIVYLSDSWLWRGLHEPEKL